MILTFTPAFASALAHITPDGPAPTTSTSTLLSRGTGTGMADVEAAKGGEPWRAEAFSVQHMDLILILPRGQGSMTQAHGYDTLKPALNI